MELFSTIPRGMSIPFQEYSELSAIHSFGCGWLATLCVLQGSFTMENFQIAYSKISWKTHIYSPKDSGEDNKSQRCTSEQKCPDCQQSRQCVFEKLKNECRKVVGRSYGSENSSCIGPEFDKAHFDRRRMLMNKVQRWGSQSIESMLRYQKQHQWHRRLHKKSSNYINVVQSHTVMWFM